MKAMKNTIILLVSFSLFTYIISDDVEGRDSELNGYKYTVETTRDEKSNIKQFKKAIISKQYYFKKIFFF